MKLSNYHLRGTAIAVLLSIPLASGAVFAQETGSPDQSGTTGQGMAQSGTSSGQMTTDEQLDSVVAMVGDAEIRGSDVMTVIGMLPPQLQSQPPQMLVPMALDQLILRELILDEARGQNLVDDPEVVALVENSTQMAEDDAMVQIWLDREMANVVTDEAVQQTYDQAQSDGQQEPPPLEEVRPQIEQFLTQQAMQRIQMQLREGADVVFYDPSGQPMKQESGGAGDGSGNMSGGGSIDGTSGQSSDDGSDASGSSNQPAQND